MKAEILEVSDICPDTNHTIRVVLLKRGEIFEILTEAKELVNNSYDFVPISTQTISSDEKTARRQFQTQRRG